jgi:hypothetical protein
MDDVRAIVVPFNFHENYFSSTLLESAYLLRNYSFLGQLTGKKAFRALPEMATKQAEKVLILRNSYSFRESGGNFFHLFSMPPLVRGDHFEPFIYV